MILGEKLKKIRTDRNLTMDALVDRLNSNQGLNISKSMVSRWENNHSAPSGGFVAAYAREFGIDMNYLVGIEFDNSSRSKEKVKIYVLGSVPAGVPVEAVENILYEIEIDAELARTGDFFGLVIKGDSMAPKIEDGDIIIVKQQSTVESGDIGVVYVNGYEATCKKIIKTKTGIILQPINTAYPTQAFDWSETKELPVAILGKVFEIRRRLF